MRTDRVAVVTMAYGDAFLPKWIDHHAAQVGRENLYVLSHGASEAHDALCRGLNHVTLPRRFGADFERVRYALLNDLCNGLLAIYAAVILLDQDEMVVPAPHLGTTLGAYVPGLAEAFHCPIGLNVFADPPDGPPLDWARPVLRQAPLVDYSASYTKPCIRRRRGRVSLGNHAASFATPRVDPNLLLFHLKAADPALTTRYAAVADEMRALDATAPGVADWLRSPASLSWLNFARKRHVPHSGRGPYPVRDPVEATADVRRVGRMGRFEPRWRGVLKGQTVPAFRLPEGYRDLL